MAWEYHNVLWLPKEGSGVKELFYTRTTPRKQATHLYNADGNEICSITYAVKPDRATVLSELSKCTKIRNPSFVAAYLDSSKFFTKAWFPNDFDYFSGIPGQLLLKHSFGEYAVLAPARDYVTEMCAALEKPGLEDLADGTNLSEAYKMVEGIGGEKYAEITEAICGKLNLTFREIAKAGHDALMGMKESLKTLIESYGFGPGSMPQSLKATWNAITGSEARVA
jgi:hypothetical protein